MRRRELTMGSKVVLRPMPVAPALAAAIATALACSSPPSEQQGPVPARSGQGMVGVYYLVSLSRPTGGRIVSRDGQVNCGTGASLCGPARFSWNDTAVFDAIPDPGNMFGTWAGDCSCRGPCQLSTKPYGADKYIVAVFDAQGVAQHCNFTDQKRHGPEYLNFLGRQPDAFTCTDGGCHGANLQGAGIAPGCTSCHVNAGWTSWRTNCSFCHGRRSAETKPGYALADHPAWAAPPDSTGQRLTGTAAPARTGAHQAHLAGVTSGGLRLAAPTPCATCHPVPADLSHVGGAQSRATVALSGAQASLPGDLGAYDRVGGTCVTYCHGSSASPAWSSTGLQCGACHALPPAGHLPFQGGVAGCATCHPSTVLADGTIDLAGGKHVNGAVETDLSADDGASCSTCHGDTVTAGPPHFGAPPTLADCAKCHGGEGHPVSSGPPVSDDACGACHTERG